MINLFSEKGKTMKTFVKMFTTVVWPTAVVTVVCSLCALLSAEEIKPHLQGRVLYGPAPGVMVDDFRNLPYDYAENLHPELYYWWALAHNERQYARTNFYVDSVIRVDNTVQGQGQGFRPRIGGKDYYSRSGTTTIRTFTPHYSDGPAVIYNPYYR